MATVGTSDALSPHADVLREVLAEATSTNCIEIARVLLKLAVERRLPVPRTHQVAPLDLDKKTPLTRRERRAMRMVLPLRPEAKRRLGFAPDDFVRFPAWPYHVTTEFVARTLVDCLTGEVGASIETYVETYFECSEYLGLIEFDVTQDQEPA